MYAGSLFHKSLLLLGSWRQHRSSGGGLSFDSCRFVSQRFLAWLLAISSNVLAWRNYVVVSTVIIIMQPVEPFSKLIPYFSLICLYWELKTQ